MKRSRSYPGIAMIFFLSAAAGGLVLVFNILIFDVKHHKALGMAFKIA